MKQIVLGLCLVSCLWSGTICQTIASRLPLSSATGGALSTLETGNGSLSGPSEWVMEGYNPQRNRATTEYIAPPLKLAQELMMGRDTLVGSPVVVANDLLLVEENYQLHAVTYEGEERWSAALPGSFLSPAVAGKVVFVRAESGEEGYLVALQAGSGKNIWQFKFPSVGSSYGDMGGHVTSPVVVEGLVLVGAGRSFYAFKTDTGHVAWTFQMAEPISSSAAVAGKTVFFTDFNQLYAIDLKTGVKQWQFEPETEAMAQLFAPVISGDEVFTTSGDTIYALDAHTGQRLWQRSLPSGNLIPAGASGEQVYVKSTQQLSALDRATGAELWSFQAANFVSLPAITVEHLYVVTRAGGQAQLRALDRSNGQEIWQVEDDRLSNTAPVIANEQVYVRTVDGSILIYESKKVDGLSRASRYCRACTAATLARPGAKYKRGSL